jgi:hypothetical protein
MSPAPNKIMPAIVAAIASRARLAQLLGCLLLGVTTIALAGPRSSHRRQSTTDPGLTAHEWGTFTTIAGFDGKPVDWTPVQIVKGEPDLPGFVEHFRYSSFKGTLRGTVRMETPVIYFYSARETSISVHVSFSRGILTEWYPHATRFRPSSPVAPESLYDPHEDGSITWDSVTVSPSLNTNFPAESAANHYYTARDTSATPLSAPAPSGDEHEKFLFYRGVSTVALPLSAKALASGDIQFDNRAAEPVPALILFERRGDKLGYRIVSSPKSHLVLETPSVSGTFDSLRGDLEDILVAQGLYPEEARAMVATWRDSWFGEGSRLFYIVPCAYLNSILPLSITPAPAQVVRVFVGRIELITPATERSIATALTTHDGATLEKYGRFLGPIFDLLVEKQHDPQLSERMDQDFLASF